MKPKKNRQTKPTTPTTGLREQILADFTTLRIPVTPEQLDAALRQYLTLREGRQ